MDKEIKHLSKVIRSFGEGKSPEELLLTKRDALARHILEAGYTREPLRKLDKNIFPVMDIQRICGVGADKAMRVRDIICDRFGTEAGKDKV